MQSSNLCIGGKTITQERKPTLEQNDFEKRYKIS